MIIPPKSQPDQTIAHSINRSERFRKRTLEIEASPEPGTKRPRHIDMVRRELLSNLSSTHRTNRESLAAPSRETYEVEPAESGNVEIDAETPSVYDQPIGSSQSQDSAFSTSTTLVESVAEPSAAETLRLRLRYAMYKVNTDQIESPISRLEIDVPRSPLKPQLVIRDPPAETMRRFHGLPKKTAHSSSGHRPLQVLEPGPEIRSAPTYGPWEPDRSAQYGPITSPVWSAEKTQGPYYSVSTKPVERTKTSRQCSPSPKRRHAVSQDRDVGSRRPGGAERDITSSAVKGTAADSLLRLGGRA